MTGTTEPLLDLWIFGAPVPWSRTLGRTRYKATEVGDWQEHVREAVEAELSQATVRSPEASGSISWPGVGPYDVRMLFSFPGAKGLVAAGDPDNYAKAVLDALNGVLWRDDRFRYVRRLTIDSREGAIEGIHLELRKYQI